MRARSAIGAVGAAALVTTGLTPAIAAASGGGHHSDEVRVVVCKIVKSDHRWHNDHNWKNDNNDNNKWKNNDNNNDNKWRNHDETFGMKVWTDSEKGWTRLGDKQCASFKLDFDRNKVRVKEYVDPDRWDTYFKAYGDVLKSKQLDSKFRVKFDDSEKYPFVKIFVINKKVDHRHWNDNNNNNYHHYNR